MEGKYKVEFVSGFAMEDGISGMVKTEVNVYDEEKEEFIIPSSNIKFVRYLLAYKPFSFRRQREYLRLERYLFPEGVLLWFLTAEFVNGKIIKRRSLILKVVNKELISIKGFNDVGYITGPLEIISDESDRPLIKSRKLFGNLEKVGIVEKPKSMKRKILL